MEIKEITKYKYKGKEYKTLQEIKDVVHNTIGVEVIDKITRVCPPEQHKNIIKMLDVLCNPEVREVLTKCYSITFEKAVHPYDYSTLHGDTETVNILDL